VIARASILSDAEYFATELIRRLEALQRRERGRQRSQWQLAARLTRSVRGELRRVIEADRARRRLEATRP
jgi:hypothetical protein